jgi:hypothetical protein
MFHAFYDDRRGVMAVTFALSLLPVIGVTGAAIDYGILAATQTSLQARADEIALRTIEASDLEAVETQAEDTIAQAFGDAVRDVDVRARRLPGRGSDYEVTVSADVPLKVISAVPGTPKSVRVVTVAVARGETRIVSPPPPFVQLSHEAADYNQIFAYCFDSDRPGLGNGVEAEGARRNMTLIADNGGTTYDFDMPVCDDGETLSLRLRNVRNARSKPERWEDPLAEQYDYYSDTTISNGNAWKLNFPKDADVAETVLCDTLDECLPGTDESLLPSGKRRNPHAATRPCAEGKFMFLGFEDRPSPRFKGDRDYDDIRIVLGCPVRQEESYLVLVR